MDSRKAEVYCYEKSVEASFPSPIRRVFLLVRLLKEEISRPRSYSREELLLIAERCENHRRSFQDVCALFRASTKLSLVKANFFYVWSSVAMEIYDRLQVTSKAENDQGKVNCSATSFELVRFRSASVPTSSDKNLERRAPTRNRRKFVVFCVAAIMICNVAKGFRRHLFQRSGVL